MLSEQRKHKLAYLILVIGLVTGVAVFLGVWPDRNLQRLAAAGLSAFYLAWGLLTHFKSSRLNRGIVLEYLAVSLLAGLLLILVTL